MIVPRTVTQGTMAIYDSIINARSESKLPPPLSPEHMYASLQHRERSEIFRQRRMSLDRQKYSRWSSVAIAFHIIIFVLGKYVNGRLNIISVSASRLLVISLDAWRMVNDFEWKIATHWVWTWLSFDLHNRPKQLYKYVLSLCRSYTFFLLSTTVKDE